MLTDLQKYNLRKSIKNKAGTDYLEDVYNIKLFQSKMKSAIRAIKAFHKNNPFDAIVFCGYSGAAFAYPLSFALNIPVVCIRKREDMTHCHCDRYYEGIIPKKYIIVDDRICSGETIERIQSEIQVEIEAYNENIRWERKFSVKSLLKTPQLLAIFLYDNLDNFVDKFEDVPVYHINYSPAEERFAKSITKRRR